MLSSVALMAILLCQVYGCGERRPKSGKIVGGSQVEAQQYPWYVALVRSSAGASNVDVECGATLITQSHILTAAHCYRSIPGPSMKDAYKAVFILENRCSGVSSFTSRISKVNVHKKFNFNTLKNDIAIATLATPVNFEPVCLPAARARNRGQGTIIGYGNLLSAGQKFPCRLQEATVNVYSWNSCLKTGNYRDIRNLPNTICAGYKSGGVDTCNGDSGGPLLQVNDKGNFYIKGITSFGHGCGIRNNPGVYTDVTKYLGWIQRTAGLVSQNQTQRDIRQSVVYRIS